MLPQGEKISAVPTRIIGIELHPSPPFPEVTRRAAHCTKVPHLSRGAHPLRNSSPIGKTPLTLPLISPPQGGPQGSVCNNRVKIKARLRVLSFFCQLQARNRTRPSRAVTSIHHRVVADVFEGVEITPNFSFAICRRDIYDTRDLFLREGEQGQMSFCSKETQRWWGRRLERRRRKRDGEK